MGDIEIAVKHPLSIGILLLMAGAFFWLGRWQLERAEFNRAIEAEFRAAGTAPALDAPLPPNPLAGHRYRRVRLAGRYEAGIQILLDNMIYGGVAGYQVLTPFRLATGEVVIVNRGWVPAAIDRRILPDIELTDEHPGVIGRIDRLPRAAITLSESPPPERKSVVRLSFPDYPEIESVLGTKVERFQLLLDADQAGGFERDWSPDFDRDERNLAYAVQWFALSALALALGLGIAIRGRRRGGPLL